jgi:hypothetical protein
MQCYVMLTMGLSSAARSAAWPAVLLPMLQQHMPDTSSMQSKQFLL